MVSISDSKSLDPGSTPGTPAMLDEPPNLAVLIPMKWHGVKYMGC